ncbi:MAG: 3-oxoacyl-ACP reductase FabG [Candidatus Sulfobium sp.]
MSRLLGKIALVTGASRGIGRAIAIALAREGADMVVNYRTHWNEARELCEAIEGSGRRYIAAEADVSSAAEVSRLVQSAEKKLGHIDILVNNAGIGRHRSVDEITENDWDETIAVNLKSAFLLTQSVLPHMRAGRWGRIINISSVAAHVGGIVGPHYASSKAGLIGLMHFYASLLAQEGITVNVIAPGPVSTEMAAEIPGLTRDLVPIGRFGTPEEIADVAVMLACNGYITGQTINVNGGRYMS